MVALCINIITKMKTNLPPSINRRHAKDLAGLSQSREDTKREPPKCVSPTSRGSR